MKFFEKFLSSKQSEVERAGEYKPRQWYPVNGGVDRMESDDYENAYGNINKLAQAFKSIEPFLQDENQERLQDLNNNVIKRLYAPNEDLSDEEFREGLALKWLTHSQFYIRVHYKGARRKNGTIDDSRITGFTFLEGVYPSTVGGKRIWRLRDGTQLDSGEVMSFGGMNPYRLNERY